MPNTKDAAKAVLRGQFVAVNTSIKNEERSVMSHLTLRHKQLEREEQSKPRAIIRKEK